MLRRPLSRLIGLMPENASYAGLFLAGMDASEVVVACHVKLSLEYSRETPAVQTWIVSRTRRGSECCGCVGVCVLD